MFLKGLALSYEIRYNRQHGNRKNDKISVRNLVEFILREGDIDNRIAPGMEKMRC